MREFTGRIILIICVLICVGAVWECGKAQVFCIQSTEDEENAEQNGKHKSSEELFYEKAEQQGTERLAAEEYWNILLADNIFQDGTMELTGLVIEDMDGNVRGFFDLCPVKYQGKNALQASEYLHGEGGIVHGVATAQFIILWDENGKSYVDTWWIEGQENSYFNNKGCIACTV